MRLKTPQWTQPTGAAAGGLIRLAEFSAGAIRSGRGEIEPAGYAVAEPRG